MKSIVFIKQDDLADIRLFCCHHAGGGASFFHQWSKLVGNKVELLAFQLPGRETRMEEPLFFTMEEVVESLYEEMKYLLDKPYVLFGHSLGGLVCFELIRKLKSIQKKLPIHFIASACRAPHIPLRRDPIYNLSDAEFILKLREYNGIPKEMYEYMEELLEIFMPILRADFTISETYRYNQDQLFPVNITALCGKDDPTVRDADVLAWRVRTSNDFEYHELAGDHFFIKSAQDILKNIINRIIEGVHSNQVMTQ